MTFNLAALRAEAERAAAHPWAHHPVERTWDFTMPGPGGALGVRRSTRELWFEREGPAPLVVNVHGGGFVMNSPRTHDEVCRARCAQGRAQHHEDVRLQPVNHDLRHLPLPWCPPRASNGA